MGELVWVDVGVQWGAEAARRGGAGVSGERMECVEVLHHELVCVGVAQVAIGHARRVWRWPWWRWRSWVCTAGGGGRHVRWSVGCGLCLHGQQQLLVE